MPTMKYVKCVVCGKDYELELKRYNQKIKENSRFYCSPDCRKHKASQLCTCAKCGKQIWKTNSMLARSKSGNVFCSSSCSTSFNNQFKTGENHYAYTGKDYRKKALNTYENKCVVCGYEDDKRILEVHHIDENRNNNEIENLCVLCPNCHRKITLGYYQLTKDFYLLPINTEDVV